MCYFSAPIFSASSAALASSSTCPAALFVVRFLHSRPRRQRSRRFRHFHRGIERLRKLLGGRSDQLKFLSLFLGWRNLYRFRRQRFDIAHFKFAFVHIRFARFSRAQFFYDCQVTLRQPLRFQILDLDLHRNGAQPVAHARRFKRAAPQAEHRDNSDHCDNPHQQQHPAESAPQLVLNCRSHVFLSLANRQVRIRKTNPESRNYSGYPVSPGAFSFTRTTFTPASIAGSAQVSTWRWHPAN